MNHLRTSCFLLVFACSFINYSTAQQPIKSESAKKLKESSSKVNPETKRFESKEGNFSIGISQAPVETRDLISGKNPKKWIDEGKQFFWQVENTHYSVMYAYPFDSDEEVNSLNLGWMNSRFKSVNEQRIASEKEITLGRYSGKEFRYTIPNGGRHIMRNFLIGNTGYFISAAYIDEKDEKAALEVLDTFRLLTEEK